MHLPEKLLQSLIGINGFDKEAFKKVHESEEKVTSIRINPSKLSGVRPDTSGRFSSPIARLTSHEKVPWTDYGYYLAQRPSFTFDPLFHAGCYYVQEASSMFLEQALKQTIDLSRSLKVLDLAAAPGGKSTHIQSLISKDSLLVSNEAIRNRSNILRDNIIKWGTDNVVVTNNDPRNFAKLENYFDIIVLDAPCSGSGLFRRDEEAMGEWSENNVTLCSQRQQRILADVWPALKRDGVLVYSTCSYSKEENEDIIEWLENELRAASCEVRVDVRWKIITSPKGWRFWPDKVKGEGFFIACLRKRDGDDWETRFKGKFELLNKKEMGVVNDWVIKTDHCFAKLQNKVYAIPQKLLNDFNFLCANLHVIYFGSSIGELVREKLIPAHALAMGLLISDNTEKLDLNYEQAINYLKKKDLADIVTARGWKMVTFKNYSLGWINAVPGRINNYYPKELRILRDI